MPAISLQQLPEDCYILISKRDELYQILYVYENMMTYKVNRNGLGYLSFRNSKDAVRRDIYEIESSKAQKGYGPLLYDIALEVVNSITNGKGLLRPDSRIVSDEAKAIWDFYFTSRKSDVESEQLDSLQNELTPQKTDNVNQYAAKDNFGKDWYKSSISRGYSKSINLLNHPKVINLLKTNESKLMIRIKNVKK